MEKASAMLAVLACLLAAFVAPFASADDTAADAAQLPDHIVNGDFEYHSDITGNSWGWAAVIPTTGENLSGRWQAGPSDWDETKFGWHSTQNCDDGGECRTDAVELQQFWTSNAWAEIVDAQADTSIYQDIRVTPGNTYHWSLKHQSVTSGYVDRMQMLIGEPSKETPQQAMRTKANGGTDKIGDVGTDIATTNISDDRARNWETYEGDWTCPEGMTVV